MRYLDKSFFKFTFGFLCIIALSLALMAIAANFDKADEQASAPLYIN